MENFEIKISKLKEDLRKKERRSNRRLKERINKIKITKIRSQKNKNVIGNLRKINFKDSNGRIKV